MRLKNDKYFVVAVFTNRKLHKVTSSHKRIEEVLKKFILIYKNCNYDLQQLND